MADTGMEGYGEDEEARRTLRARREVSRQKSSASSIALVTLAVLAVFFTLQLASAIILPFLLAGVLTLVLLPSKRFLTERLRVPATLSSLLLILLLVGVVGAVGAAISVPASGWVAKAPDGLKVLQDKLSGLNAPIHYVESGVQQLEQLMSSGGQDSGQGSGPVSAPALSSGGSQSSGGGALMGRIGGVGLTILQGTGAALGQVLTLLVLLFFMLTHGDTLLRRLVEVMPTFTDKRRVVDIAVQIERNVAGYLATITVMNLLVGIANGIATWLCGLPDPLLWGTLAFLLNYIPILGPFLGVVIFFFVGLFSFPDIWHALLPAGIYLGVHVLEGETVTPMLLASRFTLNPVLVIGSLFFWDFMWGVLGALLAVPMLAIAKIVCDRIPPLMPLGHLLGGPPPKSLKKPA